MQRAFEEMAGRHDVLVVGAGIHGVWAARSAARRGLDVALAEAVDVASGTSSRSTMLAHGGLRYLAQYDFGLVRESLTERGVLTRKAPHLVRPIPFLLPFYEGAPYPKWQLKTGLRLYSLLATGSGYPRHRFLSKRQVLELEPGLRERGLRGGALYYDGQILSPERLATIVARDADAHGARVANQARVLDVEPGREHLTAGIEDTATGEQIEVRARAVLNTTGPFLDGFLEQVGLGDDMLRLTKGVHLATPPFTTHAVVVNAGDGRTFFTVPWHAHQIVGTTDTDYADDPQDVHATREDVSYLQDATRRYFPDAPVDQVRFTNAGLRNLLNVEGKPPSEVTREARVHDHADEGYAGLYSLVGGKLTTARATGRSLVDAADSVLALPPEPEDEAPLPTGDLAPSRALDQARAVCRDHDLPETVANRLVHLYGADWPRVVAGGLEPLDGPRLILGEARFAVEHEMARTAERVATVLADGGVPRAQAKASVEAWRETVQLHRSWRR